MITVIEIAFIFFSIGVPTALLIIAFVMYSRLKPIETQSTTPSYGYSDPEITNTHELFEESQSVEFTKPTMDNMSVNIPRTEASISPEIKKSSGVSGSGLKELRNKK